MGHVLHSTTPLPPREVPPLAHIFFALLAMNGPLPAELNFRENTATFMFTRLVFTTTAVRFNFISRLFTASQRYFHEFI